jgi:isoleucyl-tRNA synthetase
VHLIEWPHQDKIKHSDIVSNMRNLREVVSLGLKERQVKNVPVRQPLQSIVLKDKLESEYEEILKDELNIKEIQYDSHGDGIFLDFEITPELKEEGQYRELVRALQDMRKESELIPSDIISLSVSTSDEGKKLIEKWQKEIQKTVGIKELKFEENTGVEVKINELVFVVSIQK